MVFQRNFILLPAGREKMLGSNIVICVVLVFPQPCRGYYSYWEITLQLSYHLFPN